MPEELRLVSRSARVPSVTMRDLLMIVFRQRGLVLILFIAIFAAFVLYGWLAPSYRSEMKVLVRRGRVDPVVSATPSQAEFEREGVTEEELNSEVELLQDDEILRAVVRKASLLREGQSWFWGLVGDNEAKQTARAVKHVSKRLTVEPVRKATLIDVSYKSSDPAQAALVLRSLAEAYLERHHEVHRPSGQFDFFDQQVALSRHDLEEKEIQVMQFGRDQGVVSAAQERDAMLAKLSGADADARQTRVSIAGTVERIRTLELKLKALPERTTTQIRNLDNPQLMEKMKSKLLDLELTRTDLLTKYEPGYRPVREVEEQIAETKAAIAAEDRTPLRDQTSDQDANHEWVKTELVHAHVDMSALGAHAVAETALLGNYREAAQRLGDSAVAQDHLLQDLKVAEDKYLLYVNKREEARIGDALDQGGILNVAIAEQPTAPALPVLSEASFAAIGFALAGTLSVSLAFANDYLNPSFRTADEVLAYLGTPVLASLPRQDAVAAEILSRGEQI